MNIASRQDRWRRADGSALMAAAVAAGVLGIMVSSYLAWVTNEYRLANRSHAWRESLYLAEAGLELGCVELNFPYLQSGSGFSAASGWTAVDSSTYQKTVTGFRDSSGAIVGDFSVLVSGISGKNPVVQSVGTATVSQGPAATRAIQIWLRQGNPFPYALAAKQQVTMSGTSYVDSFDSSDSTKSTGGAYDPAKRQANAAVVCGGIGSIGTELQLTTVYGTIFTSPLGSLTLSGSIGPTTDPLQRATTLYTAELNGWVTHDLDLTIPDVTLPAALASAYNLGTINSATTISSGDWQANSLSSGSKNPIIIIGQVRLYVKGDVRTTGKGYLQISPGASLAIYIGGNVDVTGSGIVNESGLAENNQWYGLSSSAIWSVSGGAQWLGTVYAPEASVTFSGNSDIFGAFVANSLTLNGGAAFHYDEVLRTTIGGQKYSVVTWQELQYVNGSWVP